MVGKSIVADIKCQQKELSIGNRPLQPRRNETRKPYSGASSQDMPSEPSSGTDFYFFHRQIVRYIV